MAARRGVIDYALRRRRVLADVAAGRLPLADVRDAQPYLLRAARFHGQPTARGCPLCRKTALTDVTFVYGDTLGESSGRACAPVELDALDAAHPELRVFVVEVCAGCSWNHLMTTYVVGSAQPRRERRHG